MSGIDLWHCSPRLWLHQVAQCQKLAGTAGQILRFCPTSLFAPNPNKNNGLSNLHTSVPLSQTPRVAGTVGQPFIGRFLCQEAVGCERKVFGITALISAENCSGQKREFHAFVPKLL